MHGVHPGPMLKYSRTGDSPRNSVRPRFPPSAEVSEKLGASSPGRSSCATGEGCEDVEHAAIIATGSTRKTTLINLIIMSLARKPSLARWVAISVVVFLAGRLIDLAWHVTHPEFETASDQVRAHAVVWLGVLLLLLTAVRGIWRRSPNRGYAFLLGATVLYGSVAGWHFWEHLNDRDPGLPHILLLIANLAVLAAAAGVWLEGRWLHGQPS